MPVEPGKVYVFDPNNLPPTSSLAEAFSARDGLLSEAVILRGYLGRSSILQRATQYLSAAKQAEEEGERDTAVIDELLRHLDAVRDIAKPHIPWRLHLTPSLDRYVDFHQNSLLAWRQEPKVERQDTYTVWLRGFSFERIPLSYRIVQETLIGPTFSTYIGGELVDDYLGRESGGTAWGNQSGMTLGNKPKTTAPCGG